MELVTQVQTLDKAVCVLHHVNTLEKGMNPSGLSPVMGKYEGRKDENYTRMLHVVFNNYWTQHPTKQQLYNHLPPISQTI